MANRQQNPAILCKAHTSSGKPCKRYAIKGGRVCLVHGGAAPQVQAAARERLMAMVAPSLSVYDAVLAAEPGPLAVTVAKDVLDRTGHKAPAKIDLQADITARGTVIALADVLTIEQLEELAARARRSVEDAPEIEGGDA